MSEANKRILVAEADAAARVLLRRRLEAEGYDVDVVEDGEAALAAYANSAPELLVIDISLPKIDGISVIRRLRAQPAGADLPIIIISAHARDLVDRGLAGVRGPDGFFTKPIDFRELQAKVKSVLTAVAAPPVPAATGEPGKIVAFVGAKGGVGTTTIATNVAVSLAAQGSRTVLFETASFHGTAAALLGFPSQRIESRLKLGQPESVTAEAIAATLERHGSGVGVLFGGSLGIAMPETDGVFALCNGLRLLASTLVVDLDSAVDVYGQVILRTAERIWVVTEPERASVNRAEAIVHLLEHWGVNPRAVGILVNQTTPELVLEPAEVGQRIGRPVGCWIPCAGGTAFEASRLGVPLVDLAREQPAASALNALAATLVTRHAAVVR